ncbi:DnaJ domain-containing protein [Hippea alviniae]|uniref:DnaJ domain-containing protein n=1 Tax=Hippea alviniae TaxID=1279027 RepID=UPI0003B3C0E6|nr:DnaJ domain-containing protein [Hippea alviniae]
MNPYEVLGVSENITEEELRKVFLQFAKKLHPDTATNEEERRIKEQKFKEITYAYNLLKSSGYLQSKSKSSEKTVSPDEILIKKAHVYISKGDYNTAFETLRQVKDADNYEVNLLKGLALFKKGKHHEALKYYKRATELNPWDPDVYAFMGEVYEEINLKETAKKFYKKALGIDPNNKKALKGYERVSKASSGFSLLKKIIKR